MQWKRWANVGLVWLLVLIPSGCLRTLPPVEPPPYRGIHLRVACPPGLVELVRQQSRVWQSQQQATVEAFAYDPAHGPAPGDRADVWLLPPAEMPRHAVSDRLHPVPTALVERGGYEFRALLPVYRDTLLRWPQTPVALPVLGESPVCLFRADLFQEATWQEKFAHWQQKQNIFPIRKLKPPATWEEMIRISEFFYRHPEWQKAPGGATVPSLVPLPANDVALDRLFYTVAASFARRAVRQDEPASREHLDEVFSFHYDLKTGAPRIATPGFVAALNMLKRLQAFRPQGTHRRPEELFLQGKAVLCITDAPQVARAQRTPELRDRVGICPVPAASYYFTPAGKEQKLKGGHNFVPYLGEAGALGVVPRSAANAEAGWSLLAELTGPRGSLQIALEPRWAGPTRIEQALRDRWDAFDLTPARAAALKDAVNRVLLPGIKNPALVLRTPDEKSHRLVVDEAVKKVLLSGADPKSELARVSKQWLALDAKRGQARHLAEYRISLGLRGD